MWKTVGSRRSSPSSEARAESSMQGGNQDEQPRATSMSRLAPAPLRPLHLASRYEHSQDIDSTTGNSSSVSPVEPRGGTTRGSSSSSSYVGQRADVFGVQEDGNRDGRLGNRQGHYPSRQSGSSSPNSGEKMLLTLPPIHSSSTHLVSRPNEEEKDIYRYSHKIFDPNFLDLRQMNMITPPPRTMESASTDKEEEVVEAVRTGDGRSDEPNMGRKRRRSDEIAFEVPRLGGVRCYWAILTPRNGFVPTRQGRRIHRNSSITTQQDGPLQTNGYSLSSTNDFKPLRSTTTHDHQPPRSPPVTENLGTQIPPHVSDRPKEGFYSEASGSDLCPEDAAMRDAFELDFVYLDPILSVHMKDQANSLIGRGLLEFIHPEVRQKARADLYDSLSVDDLLSSVTRTSYARTATIRILLGCPPEDAARALDEQKFALNKDYLHVDLSIHWAGKDLLLAFFHAAKDKDPDSNNDIKKKQEDEWTNFCGTQNMPSNQIDNLWAKVTSRLSIPTFEPGGLPPERIFFIYATPQSKVRPDEVIFAWPPPRNPSEMLNIDFLVELDESPSGLTPMDGSYSLLEMIELMKRVQLDSAHTSRPWGDFGRSSCTARFQRSHRLFSGGLVRDLTSVFIPYGNLIFASFQTAKVVTRKEYDAQNLAMIPIASLTWHHRPRSSTSRVFESDDSSRSDVTERVPAAWSQAWSQPQKLGGRIIGPPTFPSQVAAENAPHAISMLNDGSAGASFSGRHNSDTEQQSRLPYMPSDLHQSNFQRSRAPSVGQYTYNMIPRGPILPVEGTATEWNRDHYSRLPPLHRPHGKSPYSGRYSQAHEHGDLVVFPEDAPYKRKTSYDPLYGQASDAAGPSESRKPSRESGVPEWGGPEWSSKRPHIAASDILSTPEPSNAANGTRLAVPPPQGVEHCVDCGRTQSPEWRKSERGVKEMCNACGLKLARRQAKAEGRQKPRKKKP